MSKPDLIVTQPFLDYPKGQRLTDPAEKRAALAEYAAFVVQVPREDRTDDEPVAQPIEPSPDPRPEPVVDPAPVPDRPARATR